MADKKRVAVAAVVVVVSIFFEMKKIVVEVPPIRLLVPPDYLEATRTDPDNAYPSQNVSHVERIERGLKHLMESSLPEIPTALKYVCVHCI